MSSRIDEIVKAIRREIELEERRDSQAAPQPGEGLPPLRGRAELAYLNAHWLLNPDLPLHSHRPVVGPLIVAAKTFVRRLVFASSRRSHLLRESLRVANMLAERSDRLQEELNARTRGVAERNDVFLAAFDLRLEALEASEQLRTAAAFGAAEHGPEGEAALVAEAAVELAGAVWQRVEPFLERFPAGARVLEVGCGNGEVLEHLVAKGVSATGIEASPLLVATCAARRVSAQLGAVPESLGAIAGESLDGVIVSRLGDRVAPARWPWVVAAAWRALRPGGAILLEGAREARPRDFLRWLLARQRFHDVEVRASGEGDHVLFARRGEAA